MAFLRPEPLLELVVIHTIDNTSLTWEAPEVKRANDGILEKVAPF